MTENDYCLLYDITSKRLAELEKENAELRADNEARKFAMTMSEKVEKKLRQKNAELKKKYINNITDCDICDTYCNSLLIKAKEIIKKFSEFVNNEIEYDPEHPQEHTDKWNELCKQAEQFLKEIEK